MSVEDTMKLLSSYKPPRFIPPQDKEEKEIEPIKLKVDRVTADGNVNIKFNQKMIVPFSGDSSRSLQESKLNQLDMNQVFKVSFGLRSDVTIDKLQYSIVLNEWTPEDVKLKIDFQSPLFVSQGEINDDLKIEIIQPALFVSAESGEVL